MCKVDGNRYLEIEEKKMGTKGAALVVEEDGYHQMNGKNSTEEEVGLFFTMEIIT